MNDSWRRNSINWWKLIQSPPIPREWTQWPQMCLFCIIFWFNLPKTFDAFKMICYHVISDDIIKGKDAINVEYDVNHVGAFIKCILKSHQNFFIWILVFIVPMHDFMSWIRIMLLKGFQQGPLGSGLLRSFVISMVTGIVSLILVARSHWFE